MSQRKFGILAVAVLGAGLVSGPASAEQRRMNQPPATSQPASVASVAPPAVPDYGIGSYSVYSMFSYAFQGDEPYSDQISENGNGYRWMTTGSNLFIAPVHVPSGVTINYFGFSYCDSNPAPGAYFTVTLYDSYGDNAFSTIGTQDFPDTTGCGYLFTPALGYDYDQNSGHVLSLYVFQNGAADGTIKFRGAEVGWVRRVSPAPATQTFNDVAPGDFGYQYIEALVASGVTGGCGGGNYCPNANLTRAQMAVFISKALGLHWPF